LFGYLVTTELLVFGIAWVMLLRERHRRQEHAGAIYLAAGMAAACLSLFFFSARFRILSHNKAERVAYDSQPCYLIETRQSTALLFCPLGNPRSVVVDPTSFRHTGQMESIFTPLDGR
jgi:hypothetical protein